MSLLCFFTFRIYRLICDYCSFCFRVLQSLCGHTTPVESLAFDSMEVLVLGGASSGTVKLWDLQEAKSEFVTLPAFFLSICGQYTSW